MDAMSFILDLAIIALLVILSMNVGELSKQFTKLKRGSTSTEIETKIAALYERIKSDVRMAKIDHSLAEAEARQKLRIDLEAKIARCPHATTIEALRHTLNPPRRAVPSAVLPGVYLHQREGDVAYALHSRQGACPAPPPHGEGVCTPRRPFQRDAMNRPHRRKDDPSGPGTPTYLHMRTHDHGPDCAPAHTHTRASDANSGPEDGAHFHHRKDDSILAAPMHRRGTGRMRGPDLVPNIVPGQLRRDPQWNHHRSTDQAMYRHNRSTDRGWSPGQAGGLRLNYGHIRATDSAANGIHVHHRSDDPLLEVQS